MFCVNCGKEMQEGAAFCQSCSSKKSGEGISIKTNFRIISKAGLLLVVLGFFMPMACSMNGLQIAENMISINLQSNNTAGLYMRALFVSALAGVIIGALLLMKLRRASPAVSFNLYALFWAGIVKAVFLLQFLAVFSNFSLIHYVFYG